MKDDEISFLRGHLSQISEKIPKSLPPSEEEIKKKGWWQFWKVKDQKIFVRSDDLEARQGSWRYFPKLAICPRRLCENLIFRT